MCLWCGNVDVEEVLEHGGFRALQGILVGIEFVLLLGMAVEIVADEDDSEGNDQGNDERGPQSAVLTRLWSRRFLVCVSLSGRHGSRLSGGRCRDILAFSVT